MCSSFSGSMKQLNLEIDNRHNQLYIVLLNSELVNSVSVCHTHDVFLLSLDALY